MPDQKQIEMYLAKYNDLYVTVNQANNTYVLTGRPSDSFASGRKPTYDELWTAADHLGLEAEQLTVVRWSIVEEVIDRPSALDMTHLPEESR